MASLMVSLTQESLTKRNLMIKIRTSLHPMVRNQRQILEKTRNLMTVNLQRMARWCLLQRCKQAEPRTRDKLLTRLRTNPLLQDLIEDNHQVRVRSRMASLATGSHHLLRDLLRVAPISRDLQVNLFKGHLMAMVRSQIGHDLTAGQDLLMDSRDRQKADPCRPTRDKVLLLRCLLTANLRVDPCLLTDSSLLNRVLPSRCHPSRCHLSRVLPNKGLHSRCHRRVHLTHDLTMSLSRTDLHGLNSLLSKCHHSSRAHPNKDLRSSSLSQCLD